MNVARNKHRCAARGLSFRSGKRSRSWNLPGKHEPNSMSTQSFRQPNRRRPTLNARPHIRNGRGLRPRECTEVRRVMHHNRISLHLFDSQRPRIRSCDTYMTHRMLRREAEDAVHHGAVPACGRRRAIDARENKLTVDLKSRAAKAVAKVFGDEAIADPTHQRGAMNRLSVVA